MKEFHLSHSVPLSRTHSLSLILGHATQSIIIYYNLVSVFIHYIFPLHRLNAFPLSQFHVQLGHAFRKVPPYRSNFHQQSFLDFCFLEVFDLILFALNVFTPVFVRLLYVLSGTFGLTKSITTSAFSTDQ